MQLMTRVRDDLLARNGNSRTSTMCMPLRFVITLGALAVLGVAGVADVAAQNVTTTGQVRGRVIDSGTGQAVAGAVISAVNAQTGFQRQARSSEDGLFVVRLLPPGVYNVTARIIGYGPETKQGVRVVLGSAAPVNFSLSTAAVALGAIEVVAEPVAIDVADGGVTQLVGTREIEQLPSLGRDFVDFVNLSGLVAPDPGETTGGQFAIGGQRASQTSTQIDGVDANNSFFGENRGGSRIPFVFSLESIRELQIITNGFDVEYGQFSGGIVNVVTRGGTNEVEGSVYANFRDERLTASPFINDPTDPEITTDYEVFQYAGRLSGPIKRDKAFFFVSLDGQRRREPQLPLTRGRYAPTGDTPDPVVFDEIGQYFDIINSKYGIADPASGYRPFSTTNDAFTLFGRIDWTINDSHRATFRHNYSTFTNDNEWNGNFDFQYGFSRAEEIEDRSHSFVAELQSVIGENTFNVLRVQLANEKRPRQGKDLRPTLTVNLSNGQRIRYGGTFASFNNRLEEEKIQVINNLTRVYGDHTIKVGGNFLYTHIFNRFMNFGSQFQGAGEFVFASLNDFDNLRPSSYFRPIELGGGIPTGEFDVVEWALYGQDTWQVTPRLTATIGVRYSQQAFRDSPTPVVDVERAFGFETGFAPTDSDNISPRVALAYDVKGDGRSVLRAGLGYFYGRVPYVVGGNVLQTERPVLEVICSGSIADGDPDAPPSPSGYGGWALDGSDNPANCASTGAGGVPTYTVWNRDFQYPETIKANLGYETLLGDRTKVALDFLFSQTTNLYTVRNLNLRDRQFTLSGEGGRRVFTPANQFDPTSANSNGSRRNLDFGDVLVNFNDGRARSFITKLEGSHHFGPNTTMSASYTFTKAWDNSPYSCCTASGGYADPTTGVFGPNEIGGFGDYDNAWGPSNFAREHTFIATFLTQLPLGFQFTALWRSQSGRPWTVAGDDDLNGDGITGNDRAFIFAPENLPLASGDEAERDLYRQILNDNSCVSDFVGQIIERNSCSFPWTHNLDVRLAKRFNTFGGQRAEIQVDFFNVLNGVGRLFCDESDPDVDLTSGVCGLGRVTGVFGSNEELLDPRGFDPTTGQIQYSVNRFFGQEDLLGSNLILQFQAQVAFRYFF